MAGETVNALLVIADIGGYTRFMSLHRLSLAHAQENTLRLLDAVIDAAPDLELSGLEGDAAFLYVTEPSAEEVTRSLSGLTQAMHAAFHAEQQKMTSLSACPCFHRMLKNAVPVREYVLMTEPVRTLVGPPFADLATPVDEELEGLGTQRLSYVDLAATAAPIASRPPGPWFERASFNAAMTARAVPYLIGLKKAAAGGEG